jgi:hypothetical protein
MGNMVRPTGAMIVPSIFICLCLIGQSVATLPDISDPLSRVREYHSAFISHDPQSEPSLGQPQLSDRKPGLETFPPNLMPQSPPEKEHIAINGNGQTLYKNNTWLDSESDDGIENMVDNAMMGSAIVSKQHDGPVNYQSHSGSPEQQRLGNYMNIDVSGINVQAMNTVQGGSAVATSNIEIKPVQIINCPPEVEEKLK